MCVLTSTSASTSQLPSTDAATSTSTATATSTNALRYIACGSNYKTFSVSRPSFQSCAHFTITLSRRKREDESVHEEEGSRVARGGKDDRESERGARSKAGQGQALGSDERAAHRRPRSLHAPQLHLAPMRIQMPNLSASMKEEGVLPRRVLLALCCSI